MYCKKYWKVRNFVIGGISVIGGAGGGASVNGGEGEGASVIGGEGGAPL